jgi:carbon storage regulator
MLILQRKVGEVVNIGANVTIKVLAVSGRSIRLGIQAPRTLPVWRAELVENGAKSPSNLLPLASS